MKKLSAFYKKHIVAFQIVFCVLCLALFTAALIAFIYFFCGAEFLKTILHDYAICFVVCVIAFVIFAVYALTKK